MSHHLSIKSHSLLLESRIDFDLTEKEIVDGQTKDRGEKSVEETLREFRSELTSLRDRMNDVEKQMEQRQNVIGGNGAIAT